MICKAVNPNDVYLWIFIAAAGIGLACGTLLKLYLSLDALLDRLRGNAGKERAGKGKKRVRTRVIQPAVQISLYLSVSAAAGLGAIMALDLPQVFWSRMHLFFFLISVATWLFIRYFIRFVWVPCIALIAVYVLLAADLCSTWACVPDTRSLVQVRILSRKETTTSLELQDSGERGVEFRRLEGDAILYRFQLVRFPEWLFYPGCRVLYRFDTVYGSAVEVPDSPGCPFFLKGLKSIGLAEYSEKILQQKDIRLLETYDIGYDAEEEELFLSP